MEGTGSKQTKSALDFFNNCRSIDENRRYWKRLLSPELKEDPEVVIAAVGCRAIEVHELPAHLRERDFLLHVVCVKSKVGMHLLERFKQDAEFAGAIQDYNVHDDLAHYDGLPYRVSENFPGLNSDQDVWTTIIGTNGVCVFDEFSAPGEILADQVLMEKACSINPDAIGHVSTALLHAVDFFATVLENCPVPGIGFPASAASLPGVGSNRLPHWGSDWLQCEEIEL